MTKKQGKGEPTGGDWKTSAGKGGKKMPKGKGC